jgi:excinuclease UvrABC ATPase subunit
MENDTKEIVEEVVEELVEEEGEIVEESIDKIDVPEVLEEVQIKGDGRKFSELSNLEKIRMASAQHGVQILEPKSSCKSCYGSGIVSTRIISSMIPNESTSAMEKVSEEIPNPCKCLFKKEDRHKMFNGLRYMTRKLEKEEDKKNRKLTVEKTKTFLITKQNLERKAREKKNAKKRLRKKFNRR